MLPLASLSAAEAPWPSAKVTSASPLRGPGSLTSWPRLRESMARPSCFCRGWGQRCDSINFALHRCSRVLASYWWSFSASVARRNRGRRTPLTGTSRRYVMVLHRLAADRSFVLVGHSLGAPRSHRRGSISEGRFVTGAREYALLRWKRASNRKFRSLRRRGLGHDTHRTGGHRVSGEPSPAWLIAPAAHPGCASGGRQESV